MSLKQINHTYASGEKRFEVQEEGNYIVLRARKNAWNHLINAAYIGISTKKKAGSPFPPTVASMVLSLKASNRNLFKYPNKLNDDGGQ